jgi:hypothetical protein
MIFLELCLDISTPIVESKAFSDKMLISIHSFFKNNDLDIIEISLKVIHELSGPFLMKHLFVVCFQFSSFKFINEFINRISKIVFKYPNLLHILFAASIYEKSNEKALGVINELNNEKKLKEIKLQFGWFIWPSLLALNSPQDEQIIIT